MPTISKEFMGQKGTVEFIAWRKSNGEKLICFKD